MESPSSIQESPCNDVIKENTWTSAKIGSSGHLVSGNNRCGSWNDSGTEPGEAGRSCDSGTGRTRDLCPELRICRRASVFLAFKWKLVPVFGRGQLKHYILPVAAYAIGGIAYTKYTRSSMISVIGEDYIVTAQAKGCKRKRIVKKHVLRNSMIPIITMIGPADFRSVCRFFILEKCFPSRDLAYYVKAVSDNDYTMIIGLLPSFCNPVCRSVIVVDILYGIADPRIRVAKGKK